MSIRAKTALVTGAAGGLGCAIGDALAEAGVTVYGTSRDGESAELIARRYGTSPVQLDIRDTSSIANAVSLTSSMAGPIDFLVNNAGVNAPQPALEVDPTSWDLVHETNVRGTFFTSQAFAQQCVSHSIQGAIVNVASQTGFVAIEDRAAYGSSKAAVIHMTKQLAFEWGSLGIRVNAVAPTFVRTELTASTLADPTRAAALLDRIPLARFGEPEEIASGVLYLLSDGAALVTGHTLTIDGGYTIH